MSVARAAGVVAVSLLLQIVLVRYAVGGAFAFDLVLVAVVLVALAKGPVAGMLAGTIGGLLQDVVSGGIVGSGGLVKTLVGCLTGILGTRFVVAQPYARSLIVAAATLVHGLMALTLRAVMDQEWPGVAGPAMLGEMAFNAAAGYLALYATESLPGTLARSRASRRSSWRRRRW